MIGTHRLDAAAFDRLAAGHGDFDAVSALARAQESRRLLQVYAVVATARERLPHARTAHLTDALDLLAHVQRTAPDAARTVLMHPYTGAWAMRCLLRLGGADPDPSPAESDRLLGHLGAIAAAAALRADPEHGPPGRVELHTVGGWAHLPTLGRARVAGDPGRIALTGRHWSTGGRPVARRQVNRRCSATAAGLTASLAIEDVDPYRDVHRWQPTARLSARQVSLLQRNFASAWGELAHSHRAYAGAMTAALSTLVPVVGGPGVSFSSSSRYAFGGLALTPEVGPTTLAVTLVHEFQHNKLGAIQDITNLSVRSAVRYRAPWRLDPRPVGALLQGAYAHLGIADFWRVRRQIADREEQDRAQAEFAVHRAHVAEAIDTLRGSGELTPDGERVVRAMAGTVASWWHEDVPAEAARHAAERVRSGRRAWVERNGDRDGATPAGGQSARVERHETRDEHEIT
ncbi:HEXXH motif domain-containing protein [Embleya sp. NBC_00888]|uniref:HEXXH motif domain-containing protein n=1 Tax=Embleya sp. NBC_00888 TaxID=2975960 RepID=UPI00386AA98A|nr:HEXXH motif domain-containing protein [Embleya sp. NBC_00888]